MPDAEQKPNEAAKLGVSATPIPESAIEKIIAAYLYKHLPDLVAAAMPLSPEASALAAAKATADEAAEAAAERQQDIVAEQKKAAKAAKDNAKFRAEAEKDAKEAFGKVDLLAPFVSVETAFAALIEDDVAILVADNGERFSVDIKQKLHAPMDLELIDGRGVAVKIALEIGDAAAPQFTIHAFHLKAMGSNAQPLRCDLVSPVTVGGGAKASFAAGSLLFRIAADAQD